MFNSRHNNRKFWQILNFEFSSIHHLRLRKAGEAAEGNMFHSSVGVTLGLASSAVSPCASVCFSTPPTSRLSETDGGGGAGGTANH